MPEIKDSIVSPSIAPEPPVAMKNFYQRHRTEILLFFGFWLSFGYFFHLQAGWNANARYTLTLALVDKHTFSIDDYHEADIVMTGDKAYYNGHFYSDKSPALSFIAVPFYAAIKPFLKMSDSIVKTVTAYRWTIFWTVCLWAALGAMLFYKLMRYFGAGNHEAILLTFFMIYGTNVGGYTSIFYPYLPATTCLLGAYVLLMQVRLRQEQISAWRAAFIGFLISMAGFLEFTFGLAGALLMLLVLATMQPRWKFVYTVLGAVPPVLILFAYNWYLFGALSLPYEYEYDKVFREGMQAGFMGITRPDPAVLYFVTVHPFKGLFFYSPILLFFLLGSLWVKRLGPWGIDLLAAWAIFVGYLLFNTSYYMWWGGWSMGSRHLIPMIPFMFMPILAALRRHPQLSTVVVMAGIVSFLLCFPAIALDPQIPAGYPDESLWHPDVRENLQSVWLTKLIPAFYRYGQTAITPFAKLPHLLSLVPLVFIWAVFFGKAWKSKA